MEQRPNSAEAFLAVLIAKEQVRLAVDALAEALEKLYRPREESVTIRRRI
jgi:hypothetical protein